MGTFGTHDFYTNFTSIQKSKDTNLMNDLIFSEVAKLIAHHKKELIKNVKALGYTIPDSKDETIIDFIYKTAHTEPKVAAVIADMIVKYHKEKATGATGEKMSNADGDFDYGALIGGVASLGGSIAGAVTASKQAKAAGETADAQKVIAQSNLGIAQSNAQSQKDMLTAVMAQKSPAMSTPLIIGLAVGGVLLITLIIIVATRKPSAPIYVQMPAPPTA